MAEWDETIEVRLEAQSELTCVSSDRCTRTQIVVTRVGAT
jgi:hypothetical protein